MAYLYIYWLPNTHDFACSGQIFVSTLKLFTKLAETSSMASEMPEKRNETKQRKEQK